MIQVELLRVSPDGNYIEMILVCQTGYHFNRLEIRRYDSPDWIDSVSVLEGNTVREVLRIATSIYGDNTMFYCNFGIIKDGWVPGDPQPETLIGVCSNTNPFYFCAHDKIQALEMQKIPRADYEMLVRWYFALWAHTEAMRLERFDDAERYYDIFKEIQIEAGYEKREFETRNFTI